MSRAAPVADPAPGSPTPNDGDGFAIGVHYLTGYAVASDGNSEPEWPPHPARLFMALAAACFETGGSAPEIDALRWLESQPPPTLIASDHDYRRCVKHFVPINDSSDFAYFRKHKLVKLYQELQHLSARRDRKERVFPRVRPHEPTVHFVWPSVTPSSDYLPALDALCHKVTRLGHASSLIQAWLEQEATIDPAGRAVYEPNQAGAERLRTANHGVLDYLQELYNAEGIAEHFELDASIQSAKGAARKQAMSAYEQRFSRPWCENQPPVRRRPDLSVAVRYAQVAEGTTSAHPGVFDSAMLVLGLSPQDTKFPRLAASAGPQVCRVLRDAINQHAPVGLECVSGHAADGSPTTRPHMAVFPLPDVGHRHADGHLLGLALALPRMLSASDRAEVIRAVTRVETLTLGRLGLWWVAPSLFDDRRKGLVPSVWTGDPDGARCWATVTPAAFDRHAKSKDPTARELELVAMIRSACVSIGLPEPVRTLVLPVSPHLGAPIAYEYPRLQRKDGSKRRQSHVLLWFDEPVVGPVLLGAGRFCGYGVCRPYLEGAW